MYSIVHKIGRIKGQSYSGVIPLQIPLLTPLLMGIYKKVRTVYSDFGIHRACLIMIENSKLRIQPAM